MENVPWWITESTVARSGRLTKGCWRRRKNISLFSTNEWRMRFFSSPLHASVFERDVMEGRKCSFIPGVEWQPQLISPLPLRSSMSGRCKDMIFSAFLTAPTVAFHNLVIIWSILDFLTWFDCVFSRLYVESILVIDIQLLLKLVFPSNHPKLFKNGIGFLYFSST